MQLEFPAQTLDLSVPRVMGILNVTPDSFSDGGAYISIDRAIAHADEMIIAGAAVIDIGGESTRPGAEAVDAKQELERVIPVIEALTERFDVPVSIDTSKPEVMDAACRSGASMINDVNALRAPGAIEVAAQHRVPVCLMHMQGQPRTMQDAPLYDDVVEDVASFLLQRAVQCEAGGIDRQQLVLDPGFGFGKTLEHNLSLLSHLERFIETGYPILAGISRKSMIGALLDNRPAGQRLHGSVAAAVIAAMKGAHIIRVHDVAETVDAMRVVTAVIQEE